MYHTDYNITNAFKDYSDYSFHFHSGRIIDDGGVRSLPPHQQNRGNVPSNLHGLQRFVERIFHKVNKHIIKWK